MAYTLTQIKIINDAIKKNIAYKNSELFSVYFHLLKDTNIIFYVGIGKRSRPIDKSSRNKYWNNTVKKHGGFDVLIVHNELSIDEAKDFEVKYITLYGRKNIDKNGYLTNLSIGGEGNKGIEKPHLRQSIKRYDLNGAFIKNYDSVISTEIDGYNPVGVRSCIKLRNTKAFDSIFISTEDSICPVSLAVRVALIKHKRVFSEKAIINIRKGAKNKNSPVSRIIINKFSNDGKLIEQFNTLKDAALSVGSKKYDRLSLAINSNKAFKNFNWSKKCIQ